MEPKQGNPQEWANVKLLNHKSDGYSSRNSPIVGLSSRNAPSGSVETHTSKKRKLNRVSATEQSIEPQIEVDKQLQLDLYAAELISSQVEKKYAIWLLLDGRLFSFFLLGFEEPRIYDCLGSHLAIWYYDRQGAIESLSMNFLVDMPYFSLFFSLSNAFPMKTGTTRLRFLVHISSQMALKNAQTTQNKTGCSLFLIHPMMDTAKQKRSCALKTQRRQPSVDRTILY